MKFFLYISQFVRNSFLRVHQYPTLMQISYMFSGLLQVCNECTGTTTTTTRKIRIYKNDCLSETGTPLLATHF